LRGLPGWLNVHPEKVVVGLQNPQRIIHSLRLSRIANSNFTLCFQWFYQVKDLLK
jgi:hypothetical protein